MAVLRDHHEAFEFDLLRHGLDVTDFWSGRMTVRRACVLVEQLLADPQSAVVRSISPADAAWRTSDYLIADLFDLTARAHFKDPKPYPRPGDSERAAQLDQGRLAALKTQQARIRARELAERGDDG